MTWLDRLQAVADEAAAINSDVGVSSVAQVVVATDLIDGVVEALAQLEFMVCSVVEHDLRTRRVVLPEVARAPEHDDRASEAIRPLLTRMRQRAVARRRVAREHMVGQQAVELLNLFALDGDDDDGDDSPFWLVAERDWSTTTLVEFSRWSSEAAAVLTARRLASDLPAGTEVVVMEVVGQDVLPEPLARSRAEPPTTAPRIAAL